jgi:hypothetical protein
VDRKLDQILLLVLESVRNQDEESMVLSSRFALVAVASRKAKEVGRDLCVGIKTCIGTPCGSLGTLE